MTTFEEYTAPEGPWREVGGWNEHGIFTALELIHDYQRDHEFYGHLCEIGVHHGQFFVALALLPRIIEYEHTIGIDVFNWQGLNVDQSGCGDIEVIAKQLGDHLTDQKKWDLLQTDSLDVTPQKMLKQLEGIRYYKTTALKLRIIRIDGGHTLTHVLNDLYLADRLMGDGGVVMLDDFFHKKWPAVTEGAQIYCNDPRARLAPFGYGNKQLYLTNVRRCEQYFELFKDVEENVRERRIVDLWKRKLVWVEFD